MHARTEATEITTVEINATPGGNSTGISPEIRLAIRMASAINSDVHIDIANGRRSDELANGLQVRSQLDRHRVGMESFPRDGGGEEITAPEHCVLRGFSVRLNNHRPAAFLRSAALLVASHEKSASPRPKCPPLAVLR